MSERTEALLAAIRQRVRSGNYYSTSHVLEHAVAEAFLPRHAVAAVLSGSVIEDYPQRDACLIAARVDTGATARRWLHVVCDYGDPARMVLVTAYVPYPDQWEVPPTRRRR